MQFVDEKNRYGLVSKQILIFKIVLLIIKSEQKYEINVRQQKIIYKVCKIPYFSRSLYFLGLLGSVSVTKNMVLKFQFA